MQYDSSPDWLITFLLRVERLMEVVISASVACVMTEVFFVSLKELRLKQNNLLKDSSVICVKGSYVKGSEISG
jgi:hypothetical protein